MRPPATRCSPARTSAAGIIEIFASRDERKQIDVALAPVWEANHVWLVLVAVLAFAGFPPLYAVVSTYLHVPVLLVLLGIVARGSAFIFRHYDPKPQALRPWYSLAFRRGSALTPFFLGVIVAALAEGRINTDLRQGFFAVFIAPCARRSRFSRGCSSRHCLPFKAQPCSPRSMVARAVPLPYLAIARVSHGLTMAFGALVLLSAHLTGSPWSAAFLRTPISWLCLSSATLLVPLVATAFRRGWPWVVRLATGAQVWLILLGFFVAQFPTLIRLQSGAISFQPPPPRPPP